MEKIEKLREEDCFALVYCKGKDGIKKLEKTCSKSKNFWIVMQCCRKDNQTFNEMWNVLHEYNEEVQRRIAKIGKGVK
jgi:hypothetical protein